MRDVEQQILSRLEAELDRLAPALAVLGFYCRAPEIEVWRQQPHDYTSEIRLPILRNGQIEDVLEFHVFRDGKAVVTADEAMEWFQSEFAKIGRRDRTPG